MKQERRYFQRIPVAFYTNQVAGDEVQRWFAADLSALGLFMERPRPLLEPARTPSIVQVELPLPGIGESLWIKGEVVHDRSCGLFRSAGVRFQAMARKHQRWLRDWLRATDRNRNRALPRRARFTNPNWPVRMDPAALAAVRNPSL
ncbi:MAG: PilZ domain-containing protein [Proteobacteria bacterium]|nr:PilZ domain-containing protein [Pseudomonadota bacterium]